MLSVTHPSGSPISKPPAPPTVSFVRVPGSRVGPKKRAPSPAVAAPPGAGESPGATDAPGAADAPPPTVEPGIAELLGAADPEPTTPDAPDATDAADATDPADVDDGAAPTGAPGASRDDVGLHAENSKRSEATQWCVIRP